MAFDVDDIAIGPDFIILAKGQRRVRVDGLSSTDINELRQGWRRSTSLSPYLRDQFTAAGFVSLENTHEYIVRAYLPSRYVTAISSQLTFLTSPRSLIVMVIISFGIFTCWLHHIFSGSLNIGINASLSIQNIAIIAGLFFNSLFIHELGHASTCLRISGAVGGIRAGWSHGLLLMATDVTSAGFSSRFDQTIVAAAGPVWHFSFIAPVYLLARAGILNLGEALIVSIMIFWAVIFSVLPTLYNDGYYILLEATGLDLSKNESKGSGLEVKLLKYSTILRSILLIIVATYAFIFVTSL